MRTPRLTHKRLTEVLRYDDETGTFYWLIRTANRNKVGGRAGTFDTSNGYRRIIIDSENHYEHRLVIFYKTGLWPSADTDHRNLDTEANRYSNLRNATRSQNKANEGLRASNTSGWKGVSQKKYGWLAQITVNYENHYLGHYSCPAAAHLAYVVAADKHFGEFARAR